MSVRNKKLATVTLEAEADVTVSVYCDVCGEDLEFEVDTGTRMHPYRNEIQVAVKPHKCEVEEEREAEVKEGGCEEDGYEEGYEDGYREGYNKGHEEGRQELLAELQNDVYIPSEVRARLRWRY